MKLHALDPWLHPQHKDILHKENQFVECLYELLTQSVDPPFAISIDGLWGTGKTTVMKMLKERLQDDYSTFWFNPWKYRNTKNVVLAFLQSLATEHPDEFAELEKNGVKMLKVLVKSGIAAALEIYTKGNVSLEDVEKAFSETEEGQKRTYERYQDSIKTLENEFRELVDKIGAKYTNKTIFIFFDDLDRCLPDDTIQLLEALKNLFVTPKCNVIFICGIDTRVAKNFIVEHYGDIEENFAINYFRKIFNLTISMPFSSEIRKLLIDYIQKMFNWDPQQTDALATMICSRGIQAEISSVRKYLNIVNNIYVFQKFNTAYTFNPDGGFVVHLLIVKEAWQPLYEELVQEAMKNRSAKMAELVKMLLRNYKESKTLQSEQEEFLTDYFVDPRTSFHDKILADLLSKYPTLA